MPYSLLKTWLKEERESGAPNPQQAVLATADQDAQAHARVVAIREIAVDSFLFFTQRDTRKVKEMNANPAASLVFWFELKQREVIVEGAVEALTADENCQYWQSYPREAKARFSAYAPTSAQAIQSKQQLEDLRAQILESSSEAIALSPYYCGFRLKPKRWIFYAYRLDELSDVFEFVLQDGAWQKQLLSP